MKYLKKKDSVNYKNDDISFLEYPLNDKNIDVSIVTLDGRFPKKDWSVNQKSKELFFILDGLAELTINNKNISFSKGDVVIIDPLEKYFWTGKATFLISCTPPWTSEQTKVVK